MKKINMDFSEIVALKALRKSDQTSLSLSVTKLEGRYASTGYQSLIT